MMSVGAQALHRQIQDDRHDEHINAFSRSHDLHIATVSDDHFDSADCERRLSFAFYVQVI